MSIKQITKMFETTITTEFMYGSIYMEIYFLEDDY